jgi:hypothetical protein
MRASQLHANAPPTALGTFTVTGILLRVIVLVVYNSKAAVAAGVCGS